jgi:hypothetical protein
MINIAINNSDMENAEQFIKGFGKTAEQAVSRALNKTATQMKADAVKAVRKQYTIKATTVRKSFKIKKAGNSVLEAAAVASGPRLGLINFGARPSKPNGKRTPVSVLVKKQRKIVKNAFIAQMPTGHIGVFHRTGKFGRNNKRKKNGDYSLEKIQHISTLPVPAMASQEEVEEEIREHAHIYFSEEFHGIIDCAIENAERRYWGGF